MMAKVNECCSVIVWEYEGDIPGLFSPFSDNVSNYIEQEHTKDSTAKLNLGVADPHLKKYEVDLSSNVQTSAQRGTQRSIRRQVYADSTTIGSGIVWEWLTNNGWITYDIEAMEAIEKAFSNQKLEVDLQRLSFSLPNVVLVKQGYQRNKNTGYMRPIQRRAVSYQDVATQKTATSGLPFSSSSVVNPVTATKGEDNKAFQITKFCSIATTVDEDEDCPICLCSLKSDSAAREQIVQLKKCKHRFHESCMEAFCKQGQQVATRNKPSVKFDGLNGVFTIPSKPGSANKNVSKKFQFSISSLKANNAQGLLECIKHPSRRVPSLVSYGELEARLLIAATEDVYENTRNRMAQVDQERKDIRTKEIELGNMKKKKSKTHTDSSYNRLTAMKKKALSQSHVAKPVLSTTSSIRHASPVSSSSTNRSSPATVAKSFTCRERVMHILAVRPHKKPELIARLQKEAMSRKDRNNLAMVLQQVSSLHDNQHRLQPHLYAEVQVETWPFYTESERLLVKTNMATQKPATKTSSPHVVSSTSKSPEEKTTSKRKFEETEDNETVKRNKPDAPTSDNTHKSDEPSSTTALVKNINTVKNSKSHELVKKENKDPGAESPPMVASTSDSPEYLTSYKPITTYDQRCQYKRDFQAEYPEYIELKKNVDAVALKFMELDRSWRRVAKGSPEYLRIQDEIIKAYHGHKQDHKYHDMKQRCEELHQKLSHIKKLVME